MSFHIYLLQASLALMLCWVLYRTALRGLTFFQWNRFYLLASVLLSLFLPLLRLRWGNALVAVADFGGIDWTYVDHLTGESLVSALPARNRSPVYLIWALYLSVAMGMLLRSAIRFRKLASATRTARMISKGRLQVYVQDKQRGSFTVFRRIYLDPYAYEHKLKPVLRHEMAHAVQLHSLDLLFMEFVIAMLWFNPFVYVLLRAIRENHEYLADRNALGDRGSLRDYLACLKAETIRQFSPVPASYFKSSTIKKRIIMLTNHKSKQRKLWLYTGILPLMAILLVLCQTPAGSALAGTTLNPDPYYTPMLPDYSTEGIPALFPLPEAFREKVTWGYNEKAIHPITRKETRHLGIDVAAPAGTPVYATADGVVLKAEEEDGWGKLVVLEHENGYTTFYAHLSEIQVKDATKVRKGELIGRVGNTGQSTGSHLHYEIRHHGKHMNPADFF